MRANTAPDFDCRSERGLHDDKVTSENNKKKRLVARESYKLEKGRRNTNDEKKRQVARESYKLEKGRRNTNDEKKRQVARESYNLNTLSQNTRLGLPS